mmetsp:Transcript_21290/g.34315  ORF Transcript_21290/g.34315 Transcript_21290/m.34315 type:complete len:152 (-) Transcript_21290:955-1410(-)
MKADLREDSSPYDYIDNVEAGRDVDREKSCYNSLKQSNDGGQDDDDERDTSYAAAAAATSCDAANEHDEEYPFAETGELLKNGDLMDLKPLLSSIDDDDDDDDKDCDNTNRGFNLFIFFFDFLQTKSSSDRAELLLYSFRDLGHHRCYSSS